MVYIAIGSFSSKFVVLHEDAHVVYDVSLPDSIECTPSISPCKNFVFVGCFNGLMYCMDFLNQKIVWEFTTGSKIKSSACFCMKGTVAVFGSYDKVVYCVSVKEGSKLWATPLGGSISSNPIYSKTEKTVFTATTKGTCFCLKEDNGQVLWKQHCGGPIFGTPCIVEANESIIFPTVQGILHCLNLKNGDLFWKYQVDGYVFSSLVLYKDSVIFGCHDKSISVLNISKAKGFIEKKIFMDSEISSTPFVSDLNGNDSIVAACNSGMMSVVRFNTFEIFSSIQLPGEIFASPFVYNNRIYVGCRDDNLYCVQME